MWLGTCHLTVKEPSPGNGRRGDPSGVVVERGTLAGAKIHNRMAYWKWMQPWGPQSPARVTTTSLVLCVFTLAWIYPSPGEFPFLRLPIVFLSPWVLLYVLLIRRFWRTTESKRTLSLLMHEGCIDFLVPAIKVPKRGWLKTIEICFLRVWRLEVRNWGVSRVCSLWSFSERSFLPSSSFWNPPSPCS